MLQPRTYEGRPLWGRAVYTALHGARLSSVPSGDQSANPVSVPGRSGLQRALLSVSSAQKCSRAGRLATPSGVSRAARSAVSCRSPASGHQASRSKYTSLRETGSLSRPPGVCNHVTMVPRGNETLCRRAILLASLLELCFIPGSWRRLHVTCF